MRRAIGAVLCAAMAIPPAAWGVQTSHWVQTNATDFKAGKFENVVATNLGEVWTLETWQALWFGLANGAGALVWGYGVRRGMGRTILRYVVINVAVAFAVTAVATNVLLFAFHGYTGHATDSLVHSLADRGHSLLVSIFSTNLLTSLQDKLLSGFLALIVAEYVAQRQSGEATRLPLGE